MKKVLFVFALILGISVNLMAQSGDGPKEFEQKIQEKMAEFTKAYNLNVDQQLKLRAMLEKKEKSNREQKAIIKEAEAKMKANKKAFEAEFVTILNESQKKKFEADKKKK